LKFGHQPIEYNVQLQSTCLILINSTLQIWKFEYYFICIS